jgi:hypothetical protein
LGNNFILDVYEKNNKIVQKRGDEERVINKAYPICQRKPKLSQPIGFYQKMIANSKTQIKML